MCASNHAASLSTCCDPFSSKKEESVSRYRILENGSFKLSYDRYYRVPQWVYELLSPSNFIPTKLKSKPDFRTDELEELIQVKFDEIFPDHLLLDTDAARPIPYHSSYK